MSTTISSACLSSVFDLLMFAVLLVTFRADRATFQTGLVHGVAADGAGDLSGGAHPASLLPSRPGRLLLLSTLGVAAVAVAIPYLPYASAFGFVHLPPALLAAVVAITGLYVVATEVQKRHFYRLGPV